MKSCNNFTKFLHEEKHHLQQSAIQIKTIKWTIIVSIIQQY